jgi:transcriptional regulator with XRE-family HTH domain
MPVTRLPNPTVARRELAMILHQAREQHRRSLDELAARLGVSAAQASRLDSGTRGFPVDQVRELAEWYGLDDRRREQLMALATESRRRVWWQQFDLANAHRSLIGMEQAATSISEFAGAVIPGLLQTPDYARVVAGSSDAEPSPAQIEQAVEIRMRRQEILDRPVPPSLTVVMDEVALARGPRKASVRRAQLEHLYAIAERPRVTVQVIGFKFGIYTGASNHFILLGMGQSVPDLVYSEALPAPAEYTSNADVNRYRQAWVDLRGIALDPDASRHKIAEYARSAV